MGFNAKLLATDVIIDTLGFASVTYGYIQGVLLSTTMDLILTCFVDDI